MLLIDGVKYQEWMPTSENEFERVFAEHASEIFGDGSKYFDLKHRLESKSGTVSIPDGYVVTLGAIPQIHVIELELATHDLSRHIVPQIINISSGLVDSATQQKICNTIEDEINKDEFFATKILKAISPRSIHRFFSDTFLTKPSINIVINRNSPPLEEAISRVNYPHRIIEFKTFVREGVALAVHAHMFEPLFTSKPPTSTLEGSPDSTIVPSVAYKTVEVILRIPSQIKYKYFDIPSDKRDFFPEDKVLFTFETDIGEIQTRVAGTKTQYGSYIQYKLNPWFAKHTELKVGDKLLVRVVEPMKRYRLEIVK